MRNLFKNREFQLDEILFQERNKEYGAYSLRHDSDLILTKSLFIGVGLFVAVAIVPFIVSSLEGTAKVVVDDGPGPTWVPMDPVDPPVEIPPVAMQQKQATVETIDTRVPEPKAYPVNEKKEPVTVKDYDKAVAGTETIKGDLPNMSYQPPAAPAAPSGSISNPAPEPKVNPDEIIGNVDVEAAFTGGIDSFRNKIVNSFDASGFEGSGGVLRTTITFIVERDGTITNVKANGADASFNREAERTVKSVKGKWIPAKVKGQAVRSYFKFPVSMKFE